MSSHGLVQSGMDLLTFITIGLLRDPVCHVGDWEGVRPWPRPFPAGRAPDEADDRLIVDETGSEKNRSPLMAGVLLVERASKATHIASKEPKGFFSVANFPGYSVGIKVGNCALTDKRTTSKTTSAPGAKTRSVPVAADTITRNSRLKSQKGVPFGTPKVCNFV